CNERLLQGHLQTRTCKIFGEFFAIYGDLARAGLTPDAGNSVFTLAGCIGATMSVELLDVDRSGLFGSCRSDAAEFFERIELLSHDYAFPLFLRFSAAMSRISGC